MTIPMVIIGAGGFGREVLDVVRDYNARCKAEHGRGYIEFLGFIDDGNPNVERLDRIGAKFLGGTEKVKELPKGCTYSIGIGAGSVRRKLDKFMTELGFNPITLVHSAAVVGADVEFGPGTVVCANVSVTTNVRTGRHVHINLNCTIGHDSRLEDYSTVNPLSAVSGEVRIGKEAMVGTNSAINQGLSIGEGAVIASGSAVTKTVDAHTLVAGVPAVVKKSLR